MSPFGARVCFRNRDRRVFGALQTPPTHYNMSDVALRDLLWDPSPVLDMLGCEQIDEQISEVKPYLAEDDDEIYTCILLSTYA